MPDVRLLVLQPSEADPPARLGDWLTAAGARLHLLRPWAGDPLPSTMDRWDGVVCLGGGMGVYDDDAHPWLAECRALLADAVARRVPLLAICLGAQLLAVATGGTVRRAPAGPEVGPMLVARRDATARDPLLAGLPLTPVVLQFHVDEVDALPPGAVLLAAAPRCAHQAFRVGECAWGLQFHVETTPELVTAWARAAPELAGHAPPGALAPEHLATEHAELAETWRPVTERFVRIAAGEPADPAGERHDLPLLDR